MHVSAQLLSYLHVITSKKNDQSLLCIEKIESSNRFWMLFHRTMITLLQLCLDMQNFPEVRQSQ